MKYQEIIAGVIFEPAHSAMVGLLLALAAIFLTTAGSTHRKSKIRK